MLSITELINLYENGTNGELRNKLNIICKSNTYKEKKLLNYALGCDNTEFINYILNTHNVCLTINQLKKIISNSKWHDIFKIALENNQILRDKIINIFGSHRYNLIMFFIDFDNYELIDIILANLLEKYVVQVLLTVAIMANNIRLIKTLYDTGYNLYPLFGKIIHQINVTAVDSEMDYGHYKKINLETYMYLAELRFDIFADYMSVCEICCNTNSVDVFKYFIDHGINPTDVLQKLVHQYIDDESVLHMIRLLLEDGADPHILTKSDLMALVQMPDSEDIYKYLIDYGLDITEYIHDLSMFAICRNQIDLLKYFIDLIIDIHYDDDILLRFAVYVLNIEIVEVLLENGANIYADNNNILNYTGRHYDSIMEEHLVNSYRHFTNMYPMIKLLIDKGAIINNPGVIFCTMIGKIHGEIPDREFTIPILRTLLDCGIDLNNKIEICGCHIYVIQACIYFESIELVKLCLEYGADPFVDNNTSLKCAIMFKCTDIIKLLLDLGVIFNPEWKVKTSQKIVNLLAEYQITNHKLRISK